MIVQSLFFSPIRYLLLIVHPRHDEYAEKGTLLSDLYCMYNKQIYVDLFHDIIIC